MNTPSRSPRRRRPPAPHTEQPCGEGATGPCFLASAPPLPRSLGTNNTKSGDSGQRRRQAVLREGHPRSYSEPVPSGSHSHGPAAHSPHLCRARRGVDERSRDVCPLSNPVRGGESLSEKKKLKLRSSSPCPRSWRTRGRVGGAGARGRWQGRAIVRPAPAVRGRGAYMPGLGGRVDGGHELGVLWVSGGPCQPGLADLSPCHKQNSPLP